MTDGFGLNSPGSLAFFDPASQSWKMSQACLFEGFLTFSGIWPRSGMMRNGRSFRAVEWWPHIHASECFLWPTPLAAWGKRGFGFGNALRRTRYRPETISRLKFFGWSPPIEIVEVLMGFPPGWTDVSGQPEKPCNRSLQSGSADW